MKIRRFPTNLVTLVIGDDENEAPYTFEISDSGFVYAVKVQGWRDQPIEITNFDIRAINEAIKTMGWKLERPSAEEVRKS